ncbi:tetratricopeptide repeat protein [bacterium BMS3Abin05]|nr:tetratricopeptide repeat protein [bacterium BMS3Abin05]HDL78939.1 tetratricopeptide repeat protein [Bacteroidota bacterium]
MRKQGFISGIFVFVLLISGSLFAQTTVNEWITKGDSAYNSYNDRAALKAFQAAVKLDPKNYEALWRVSRSYLDIGEHSPKDKQLAYYQKALVFADSAIHVNPKGSEGYLRRAIANGKVSLFKGVFNSIGLVKKVRADCLKAIALDPKNDVAYYVLARAHQEVAKKPKFFRGVLGLGWASREEAQKLFEKAISLNPTFIMFNLDYARLLVQMKKYDKAIEILKKIPSFPRQDEDDPQYRKEAAALLKKIEKK